MNRIFTNLRRLASSNNPPIVIGLVDAIVSFAALVGGYTAYIGMANLLAPPGVSIGLVYSQFWYLALVSLSVGAATAMLVGRAQEGAGRRLRSTSSVVWMTAAAILVVPAIVEGIWISFFPYSSMLYAVIDWLGLVAMAGGFAPLAYRFVGFTKPKPAVYTRTPTADNPFAALDAVRGQLRDPSNN